MPSYRARSEEHFRIKFFFDFFSKKRFLFHYTNGVSVSRQKIKHYFDRFCFLEVNPGTFIFSANHA